VLRENETETGKLLIVNALMAPDASDWSGERGKYPAPDKTFKIGSPMCGPCTTAGQPGLLYKSWPSA
jgi:hypothetical protein